MKCVLFEVIILHVIFTMIMVWPNEGALNTTSLSLMNEGALHDQIAKKFGTEQSPRTSSMKGEGALNNLMNKQFVPLERESQMTKWSNTLGVNYTGST